MNVRFGSVLALGIVAAASAALAGDQTSATTGSERAALYVQAGLSSGSSDMGGAAVGGTVVLDLGSRFGVEGTGAFLSRGMGSNALNPSVRRCQGITFTNDEPVSDGCCSSIRRGMCAERG
jgi:hypothetical protein